MSCLGPNSLPLLMISILTTYDPVLNHRPQLYRFSHKGWRQHQYLIKEKKILEGILTMSSLSKTWVVISSLKPMTSLATGSFPCVRNHGVRLLNRPQVQLDSISYAQHNNATAVPVVVSYWPANVGMHGVFLEVRGSLPWIIAEHFITLGKLASRKKTLAQPQIYLSVFYVQSVWFLSSATWFYV